MPTIVWEILANIVMFFAGNIGGQAIHQAREPGKAPSAVLITLVVLAAGGAIAWFVDKERTTLDYIFWAIVYGVGFAFGWREKG
jgi:hypothetical protein